MTGVQTCALPIYRMASEIKELVEMGVEVGVVIGGFISVESTSTLSPFSAVSYSYLQ